MVVRLTPGRRAATPPGAVEPSCAQSRLVRLVRWGDRHVGRVENAARSGVAAAHVPPVMAARWAPARHRPRSAIRSCRLPRGRTSKRRPRRHQSHPHRRDINRRRRACDSSERRPQRSTQCCRWRVTPTTRAAQAKSPPSPRVRRGAPARQHRARPVNRDPVRTLQQVADNDAEYRDPWRPLPPAPWR